MKKLTECKTCFGKPCVCKELKEWKPVWTAYMWEPKEKQMVALNDIPMNPKLKRLWDNSVPL